MPTKPLTVRCAAPEEQRVALALAMRTLAPDARQAVLDATRAARDQAFGALDGLAVALEHERVVGASWAQPSPGNAAVLWPPEWTDGESSEERLTAEERLIAAAVAAADAGGVGFTQLLFEQADDPRLPVAEASGFREIATLEYLGRALAPDGAPPPKARLRFTACESADRERLKRLLESTYVDTLDCPGLDGLRNLDDVIDSYETIGDPEGRVWQFAAAGNAEAGVLLMAQHSASDQAELVYMGLRPEVRGKGLGNELVAEAIRVGRDMGAEQLVVAVDRANLPAKRQYELAGFAPWAERHVMVRLPNGELTTAS